MARSHSWQEQAQSFVRQREWYPISQEALSVGTTLPLAPPTVATGMQRSVSIEIIRILAQYLLRRNHGSHLRNANDNGYPGSTGTTSRVPTSGSGKRFKRSILEIECLHQTIPGFRLELDTLATGRARHQN